MVTVMDLAVDRDVIDLGAAFDQEALLRRGRSISPVGSGLCS